VEWIHLNLDRRRPRIAVVGSTMIDPIKDNADTTRYVPDPPSSPP